MRISGRSWPVVCIDIPVTYDIGFPGWPEPNLDSVPGLGRQFKKRGLAPAPFFIFSVVGQGYRPKTFRYEKKAAAEKDERPVGGPAARAWGWRVDVIRNWFGVPLAPLRSRAAVQKKDRSKQHGSVSLAPEADPTSNYNCDIASRCLMRR